MVERRIKKPQRCRLSRGVLRVVLVLSAVCPPQIGGTALRCPTVQHPQPVDALGEVRWGCVMGITGEVPTVDDNYEVHLTWARHPQLATGPGDEGAVVAHAEWIRERTAS